MRNCFWSLKCSRYSYIFVDPAYFPGRCATIHYRPAPVKHSKLSELKEDIKATLHTKKDLVIGELGVLHPSVLEKFEISYPCSALEFALEPWVEIEKHVKCVRRLPPAAVPQH